MVKCDLCDACCAVRGFFCDICGLNICNQPDCQKLAISGYLPDNENEIDPQFVSDEFFVCQGCIQLTNDPEVEYYKNLANKGSDYITLGSPFPESDSDSYSNESDPDGCMSE